MTTLAQPFTLPCGAVLPNRLCKAAMTEGLADENLNATERHVTLYRRWAEGGAGRGEGALAEAWKTLAPPHPAPPRGRRTNGTGPRPPRRP